MAKRLFAIVSAEQDAPRSVRHFQGFPPELTGGEDLRKELAWPRVVIVEENPDGIFLFRYSEDGTCVGDTWHENFEDAMGAAAFEYGSLLSAWSPIPPEADDVEYALMHARQGS